jgi:hypothetical protein
MAAGQIILAVGTHPTLEDGDVLHAFNRREIRRKWAELLSRQYDPATLLENYLATISQYKYELIGGQLKRTDQKTLDEVWCTWCNVSQFMANYTGPLFRGDTFYGCGGKTYYDDTTLDSLWSFIESNTAYREADYPWYPWPENRRYLVLAVNDFNDATMRDFEAPLTSGPNVLKKRKSYVAWRGGLVALGATEADVLNKKKPIDVLHVRLNTSIILEKSV